MTQDPALNSLRNTLFLQDAPAIIILAGHFQTILYSFFALGLFAAAMALAQPRRWIQIFGMALTVPLIAEN